MPGPPLPSSLLRTATCHPPGRLPRRVRHVGRVLRGAGQRAQGAGHEAEGLCRVLQPGRPGARRKGKRGFGEGGRRGYSAGRACRWDGMLREAAGRAGLQVGRGCGENLGLKWEGEERRATDRLAPRAPCFPCVRAGGAEPRGVCGRGAAAGARRHDRPGERPAPPCSQATHPLTCMRVCPAPALPLRLPTVHACMPIHAPARMRSRATCMCAHAR